MKRISIIIVTYNSSKHIFCCLDSIFKYNDVGDGLEVIVIDNNSPEQQIMFDKIKAEYGNRVVLLNSKKNGGYGFGNNIGIVKSSSPIVVVMNPDVRLIQPVFSSILNKMNDESVGVLGVSFEDGSSPFYIKPECATLWNLSIHHLLIMLNIYNEKKMYMSGSFLVFSKQVFIKAGMFDENIFMYVEEPDIINRIQQEGYHSVWCKEIRVRHLAHGRDFNKKQEEMMHDSLSYYSKKYKLNLPHYINIKVKLLMIKRVIALLMNNKKKMELFDNRVKFLKSIINEKNM